MLQNQKDGTKKYRQLELIYHNLPLRFTLPYCSEKEISKYKRKRKGRHIVGPVIMNKNNSQQMINGFDVHRKFFDYAQEINLKMAAIIPLRMLEMLYVRRLHRLRKEIL